LDILFFFYWLLFVSLPETAFSLFRPSLFLFFAQCPCERFLFSPPRPSRSALERDVSETVLRRATQTVFLPRTVSRHQRYFVIHPRLPSAPALPLVSKLQLPERPERLFFFSKQFQNPSGPLRLPSFFSRPACPFFPPPFIDSAFVELPPDSLERRSWR